MPTKKYPLPENSLKLEYNPKLQQEYKIKFDENAGSFVINMASLIVGSGFKRSNIFNPNSFNKFYKDNLAVGSYKYEKLNEGGIEVTLKFNKLDKNLGEKALTMVNKLMQREIEKEDYDYDLHSTNDAVEE